jgi:CubicO group peptidase (beta-lactamase class C family)
MAFRKGVLVAIIAICATKSLAACSDPSPAFPPPGPGVIPRGGSVFESIEVEIDRIVSDQKYNTSSFAIEVTSTTGAPLWSYFHTAPVLNSTRGVREVDGDSRFRIASITKTFTALALLKLEAAGKLSLDDTVDKYIPELTYHNAGKIPWHDITLRALASQLSGIPREFTLSDLLTEYPDPTSVGLPPAAYAGLPTCDQYSPNLMPCTAPELVSRMKERAPLFAPNQKSTYSNVNFELLGLVIQKVTNSSYEDILRHFILDPIGMSNTSTFKPDDSVGAIPPGSNHWNYNLGVQAPTGALYTSVADMTLYLQWILTHYNGITHTLNWIQPASYGTGLNSFYGIPWEIFRTTSILSPISRPTTFITKGGNLDGYASNIIMIPEYDIGVTILIAGTSALMSPLREAVTVPLVRSLDNVVAKSAQSTYAGIYTPIDNSLNTTLELSASAERGLEIKQFISNGSDVLTVLMSGQLDPGIDDGAWHTQLVPTLLFKNQTSAPPQGELWRALPVKHKTVEDPVWHDFCITDEDSLMYAGEPLMEFAFWRNEAGEITEVDLTGFRIKLGRVKDAEVAGEDWHKVQKVM